MSESNKITKKQLVKASFVLVASVLVMVLFIGIISLLTYGALVNANVEGDANIEWTDIVGGVLSM